MLQHAQCRIDAALSSPGLFPAAWLSEPCKSSQDYGQNNTAQRAMLQTVPASDREPPHGEYA